MSNDKESVVNYLDQKTFHPVEPASERGQRRKKRGLRQGITRSILAAAVASLLPLHGAAAQEQPTEDVAGEAVPTVDDPDAEKGTTQLETIQVTGTRIRGGETPSPVITIGFENIRQEGFSDLGDVIRALPQNFSGGQNPGVPSLGYSGAGIQNQNITGGSALNLRGLGPDATLTLLNGRRMAYGGMTQAVDINAIPVDAVDRIEIVADGASAIYGSDAVGGVGNVVLRRDFEGVAVSGLAGKATDGGMSTREYTTTAGARWASGGVLGALKSASVDPVYVDQRSYTRQMKSPATLYPGSDLRSGLVSVHQSLGYMGEVRIDVLRAERDQAYNLFSPDGRINRVDSETTTTLASPEVEFFLPHDWSVTMSASHAKSEHLQNQHWENVDTGVRTRSVRDCLCNESRVYEVGAEGPLFRFGGREARVAMGGGRRSNDYLHFNHLAQSATTQGSESSRFAYAELNLPLAGDGSGSTGQRLDLTAAVRTEDYDSFGSVSVPKLGLVYAPGNGVTYRLSWGKSFKAPTLHQRFFAPYAMLTKPAYFGGSGYPDGTTVLAVGGGNRELEAERATTWAASIAFHPEAIPGLGVEVTWFDIDYTGRALEPITNFAEALSNPAYGQFVVDAPSRELQQERLTEVETFYNFANIPYDVDAVAALVDLRYMNVARQEIRGVDLTGSYRVDAGQGSLTLRGSWSWLESSQQNTALQGRFPLAGTLHNPPRSQGRLGAVWDNGEVSASAFANYKGRLKDVVNEDVTASFTTFDVALRFAPAGVDGFWTGVEFSLAGQNILGRAPPGSIAWLPGYSVPYDATNYSAVGRFISVGVSKRW